MSRTFALIPAAGKSTRMGRPKLALPLGDRLVIERVIDSLRQAGVRDILVVVAPHVPELMTVARAAGAEVLMLPAETPDMRATVEAGLDWLDVYHAPQPGDSLLLVPADHPVLDAEVIRQLLQTRASDSNSSIIVPAYAGHRGHPVLIDWKHVAGMRALPPGQGFNVYLRNQAAETREVLVDSPTVLLDLDTPEDYERLQEEMEKQREEQNRDRFFSGLLSWFFLEERLEVDARQRRWLFWIGTAAVVWSVGLVFLLFYLNVPEQVVAWAILGGYVLLFIVRMLGQRRRKVLAGVLDRLAAWSVQWLRRGRRPRGE